MEAVARLDDVVLPGLMRGAEGQGAMPDLVRELQELVARIKHLLNGLFDMVAEIESGSDPLTNVLNRRFLPSVIGREIAIATRQHSAFSVLLLDIDHFKSINDQYGHSGGDQVLRQFAEVVHQACRSSDFVFRYGGEEFLVVLVDTGLEAAMPVAQKLGAEIRRHAFSVSEAANLKITASIGVASFDGHPDYAYLIERADKALYRAKQAGRDQAVAASRGPPRPWPPWAQTLAAAVPARAGCRIAQCRTPEGWIGIQLPGFGIQASVIPGCPGCGAQTRFAAQRLDQLGHQLGQLARHQHHVGIELRRRSRRWLRCLLSTSSGATRLTSRFSVSTKEMRSAQVMARRVHCLPDWMWRRTSSASMECLTYRIAAPLSPDERSSVSWSMVKLTAPRPRPASRSWPRRATGPRTGFPAGTGRCTGQQPDHFIGLGRSGRVDHQPVVLRVDPDAGVAVHAEGARSSSSVTRSLISFICLRPGL